MITTKFGTSEFCKLTGIRATTLRHYVDCGIIDDVGVSANNYKKYNAKNAMDVLHARMCRGLEIPVPGIIHKSEVALLGQESLLRSHTATLKAEAMELSRKMARLTQQIELLEFTRTGLGRVREQPEFAVPSLYRLMLIGDNVPRGPESQRITKQWMEFPQYTHVAIRAPLEALLDPTVEDLPMELGIGIREEYAVALDRDIRPPVAYVPRSRNIGTVISTLDPLSLRRSDLRCLFDHAESIGYAITSDLIGRLSTYLETDRGRLYYFTASVCIK